MEQVRPLRDVFDDLAGGPGAPGDPAADPAAALDGAGHPDLPGDLVAEALVSYAATAPPQVAEQLGPFVTAHSGVPAVEDGDPPEPPDPVEGLALLDGAAAGDGWDDPLDLDAADALDGDAFTAPDPVHEQPVHAQPVHEQPDHGFGTGAQDGTDQPWAGFGDAGPAPDPTSDGWLSLDPIEPEFAGDDLGTGSDDADDLTDDDLTDVLGEDPGDLDG